ncbi:uncharacterized protein LOC129867689 [Salvelinus fontinalis]|uniref:uncharacterized protein LOC129867689 n=1 Tax=Salvelinus fontinalis TaxID=8038 RepID=UPI0024865559|nr:uncharacterized protein LOC129867689 [Salvelinus fontinalis]
MSDDSKNVKCEDHPDDQNKVVENMKDETETHETNKNRTGGKAKRKSSGRAKKTSVEEDSSIGAESSQTPGCGFRERGSIIEQLEKEAQRTLMPSLKIGTCCAPILLSFLRSLTDDQWRVIQHGMKNNLTFEQLSMLCLKIVKVVTQTALRILLPALARIMGVNLRSGATSPESQCSLTGSEDSLGSLDEREKRLLISEMNYWTKERRRNGSAGCRQKSTRRTSSSCWSPKRSQTSLQSLPATREAPLMEEPLKTLFGVTEESLLISLVEGHSNPTSSSSSELSCAIVGEVVHQLNSGLSVAIQASSGSCPPMDSQDIAAGKEVIRVASVQILAELQSKTSEPEWVGFIEPLMDPVTDDVLDAIVGTMDKMAQDFNILLDLAKKMTILGSKFLTNLQCDLDVECPSGKEGTTHFLKETGSSTSVVARKLQTLSSPDFQSKALKAVSTILTRKVSSSSGMAPSSRPSSAAPSLTEAPLNTSSTALTSVTSTATVIVKAFVGGMETIASFEGTCEAADWPVPVNDHKTGSSQKITFSPARTLYGLIRAKLRDLLTLSAREEGVAKDASLQESSDTLEKATVSTVEVQLPSTKLSRVHSESQPISALCLSNLDTSTQEVLSSVLSIYKSELSKVESKSLDVVSSSDESLEACWIVDGVLSELDDYTISQSPSPNEDLSVSTQCSQLSSEESVRITQSSTSLIQSIKKLSSNDFQTQAEEAVSKVLMRSSHSFITQISHTGLQKSPQAGLSSSSPSEIASMSSQNTASGLVETFVKGMATIFQKNESTGTVLLERSGKDLQCSHGGTQLDDTELSVKISEEKLWSTAKTICVSMKNTLKDFFTGLKPSGSERTENASSKETLGEILVAIQSEISNLGRMKDSRELLQINDMVGTMLKEVEKSEDDSEEVCQDIPRSCSSLSTSLKGRSSLSSSSKGPRSECELEINLPGTPIPDEVPFDLTCPIVRSSCIDIRDSKMPEISTSDLKSKIMAHTDEPLHRNSPMTDSSRPPSAKASFRSSAPSFTSKGTSLVPKGDGIDIEEKEVCIPSSSGHLRELLITPDISSTTAFLLQYLMDSSKDVVMCLVTILVIRLLSKIRPSALDGPSQQAADMTETSQQLIRQVLSEFCAASRFSRTQAYSQNLHIHRVFRGVHKNLMEEFGSYNTLQAAISSQDPAFDRVLVKSLTQQLVQGCKEASRPASAATNPSDQAETERGAEQKARRSFLCFSMTKLRINFKRSKRGNKKDCHSVQEQTEFGEVSPSISQPIKKRSLIVRVFSAMMKPFRCFTQKNL